MVSIPQKAGLIRPYSALIGEIMRIGDLILIFFALWVITVVSDVGLDQRFVSAGLVSIILFLLTSQLMSLYGSWRVSTIESEVLRLCMVWAVVIFALLLIGYATKTSSVFSRRVILTWIFFTPAVLSLYRILIRLFLHRIREVGRNSRSAAIAGSGEMVQKLVSIIYKSPWLGLKVHGIFSDNHSENAHESALSVDGDLATLVNKARNNEIDVVFLAMPADQQANMEMLVAELADTTASVYFIPNFFVSDLLHAKWGHIEDIPYLSLRETPFYGVDGKLKRIEDIILGSAILSVLLIPMAIIALSVRLTSRGPVLFRQTRYGQDGNPIEVWKFRTMTVEENGEQIAQATRDDPRVTPLGALLRRTSLDELPQFFNVLQGTMSIVGPRPHAVAHNEEYRKIIYGYMLRHKVKPGITGWAQVNGWRGETETLDKMEKRVEHDIWYIRNWSLSLDFKIIFLTIFHLLANRDAY